MTRKPDGAGVGARLVQQGCAVKVGVGVGVGVKVEAEVEVEVDRGPRGAGGGSLRK